MRKYRFLSRQPAPLVDPVVAPLGQDAIDRLAKLFHDETIIDPALAVEVWLCMPVLDLAELLETELKEAPHSPLSMELRRRVKEFCEERATQVVREIERGD